MAGCFDVQGLGGVRAELAGYIRQAAKIVAQTAPGVTLRITSGYRSPKDQERLRRMWMAGDRQSLTSEPALNSRHTSGRAVDLGFAWRGRAVSVTQTPGEYFDFIEQLLAPVGVRRLGRNHFEI